MEVLIGKSPKKGVFKTWFQGCLFSSLTATISCSGMLSERGGCIQLVSGDPGADFRTAGSTAPSKPCVGLGDLAALGSMILGRLLFGSRISVGKSGWFYGPLGGSSYKS